MTGKVKTLNDTLAKTQKDAQAQAKAAEDKFKSAADAHAKAVKAAQDHAKKMEEDGKQAQVQK